MRRNLFSQLMKSFEEDDNPIGGSADVVAELKILSDEQVNLKDFVKESFGEVFAEILNCQQNLIKYLRIRVLLVIIQKKAGHEKYDKLFEDNEAVEDHGTGDHSKEAGHEKYDEMFEDNEAVEDQGTGDHSKEAVYEKYDKLFEDNEADINELSSMFGDASTKQPDQVTTTVFENEEGNPNLANTSLHKGSEVQSNLGDKELEFEFGFKNTELGPDEVRLPNGSIFKYIDVDESQLAPYDIIRKEKAVVEVGAIENTPQVNIKEGLASDSANQGSEEQSNLAAKEPAFEFNFVTVGAKVYRSQFRLFFLKLDWRSTLNICA